MATTEPATEPKNSTPVLRVTTYERVSSSLITVVIALTIAALILGTIWFLNRRPPPIDAIPLELIELPGGEPDGFVDETLNLESPEEEIPDPSLAETPSEESEIQEMLEVVVDLADVASQQTQEQFDTAAENTGKVGSASGTGRRALGMGPGVSGMPRSQRWFIRFSDRATVEQYASELEFFGIELGVLKADEGKLYIISNLTAARPKVRTVNTGKGETRLYMTWQGGNRREADSKLFRKAGIDVGRDLILHFYPPKTEGLLARLERDKSRKPVEQISRTYFVVQKARSGGYEFVVTRLTYL